MDNILNRCSVLVCHQQQLRTAGSIKEGTDAGDTDSEQRSACIFQSSKHKQRFKIKVFFSKNMNLEIVYD